jgi:potassium/hydrogen antiporter
VDEHLNFVLLVAFATLLVAVLAVRVAARTGLPTLLLYLALGVALGEAGLGIEFDDYRLTADLGLLALAVILAEGGLTTRWSVVRPALPFAAVLATVGVVISTAVVAGFAHLVLGLPVRTAVVLGGVLASTDAAAVFSVLRRLPLAPRVRSALEAESGLNDAPAVVIVVLASSDSWGTTGAAELAGIVALELAGGAAVGVAVGRLGRAALTRLALPSAGLYPLATVGLVLLAFTTANAAHASGFLAAYVAGLAFGNGPLPHRRAVLGFAGSVALLAEVGLFVLLGLLASPARLPGALGEALLIGAVATLLARPLAVLASGLPFRLPTRHLLFLSWAGLRGAVPVVLATIPVTEGLPGAHRVVDIVFVLVVVYTLVQAPTLPWVGRRLGVVEPAATSELEVETAPLEELGADMIQLRVPPGSRLQGVYVDELRLPDGAQLSLVVRDGEPSVPSPRTRIAVGDQLLVVVPVAVREATEERLRAVGRRGELAGWLGETGRERR